MNGLIEYRAHPFWLQKYCPSHETDGTPRCCSCERMEVGINSSMALSKSEEMIICPCDVKSYFVPLACKNFSEAYSCFQVT